MWFCLTNLKLLQVGTPPKCVMQCVMTCRPILYWILYRCEVTLEVTEGSRKPRKEENQHYSAMTSDKSPTCLLVLCGLPAAGKTSIARRLVDYIQQTDELGGVHNDVDTRWMPYLTLCHYYQTRTRAIGNSECIMCCLPFQRVNTTPSSEAASTFILFVCWVINLFGWQNDARHLQ